MTTQEKLLAQASEYFDKTQVSQDAVVDLDANIREELGFLASLEIVELVRTWQAEDWRPVGLPSELDASLRAWTQAIGPRRVAEYCSAVVGMFSRILLDSSADELRMGRIESLSEQPYFEVVVFAGSDYNLRQGIAPASSLRFELPAIVAHIETRCDETPDWSEIAWRAIATSLPEKKSILPGLIVVQAPGAAIGVELDTIDVPDISFKAGT